MFYNLLRARNGERSIKFENGNLHAHFKNAAILMPMFIGIVCGIIGTTVGLLMFYLVP